MLPDISIIKPHSQNQTDILTQIILHSTMLKVYTPRCRDPCHAEHYGRKKLKKTCTHATKATDSALDFYLQKLALKEQDKTIVTEFGFLSSLPIPNPTPTPHAHRQTDMHTHILQVIQEAVQEAFSLYF